MNRRRVVIGLGLGLVALLGGVGFMVLHQPSTDGMPDPKPLTVDEVESKVNAKDGKTFVYDNNDQERWAKGHVPTAKWVAFNKVTAADLPADKSATLIFYCAHEL